MNLRFLAGVAVGIFAAPSLAPAASIAQWDFLSSGSLTTATTVSPNANAGSLLIGASTRGANLAATPTWTFDYYASKPVMTLSRSDNTAAEVYFQVTLNANSGYELNMDNWTFDGAAGGGLSGERTYNVKAAVNGGPGVGFETGPSLASGGFTVIRPASGSAAVMQNIAADLSSSAYDHLTSLTMRVYFYTPTTSQNIDVDRLTFNGGVFAVGQTVGTWNVASAGDWSATGNWSGTVPNGIDKEADFLSSITANRTVFADTPVTVGAIRFNNSTYSYNVTGAASLTMDATTSGLIQVQAGTHKINLPLTIAQNTDLDIATGATLKISNPVTINAGKGLTQIGPGTGTVTYESTVTLLTAASIAFGSSQHLAALTVGDNASATLKQDGALVLESDGFPSISSTGGKVDLKDNRMVFRDQDAGTWSGTAYTGVSGLVASDKLTTSMPDAASLLTTLAVKTDGNGDTNVVYSYAGDSNIDGIINGDDFTAIDAGFSADAKFYTNGDFDYSGKINADDYWLIDRSYSKQTSPFGSAAVAGGVAAVPEPASAGVLGIWLAAMLSRRRRRA